MTSSTDLRIYGYWADIPQLNRLDEMHLVCLWLQRWRAAGWDPCVLNEWTARKHPYFAEYDSAVSALPTVNPDFYDRACWIRWLALAQVGGGLMSDFDLLPYEGAAAALVGRHLLPPKLQMYQSCAPSLVFSSKSVCEALCREFALGKWGIEQVNGRPHTSDMYAIAAMPEGELVQRHDIVKGYRDEGWETAPFVHYSSGAMKPDGKDPKWKWIPKLRK